MEFKAIILFALIGFSAAVPVLFAGDHGHHEDEHHDAPAHYEFSYSVHDSHTGDIKSQHESRHGDKVDGEYSLVEPDGHKRTVKYTSDKHTGFNAHVEREGTDHHVVETHHVAPVKYETHVPVAFASHHVAHVQPVAIAHHVPVNVASHGHATSHSSIQIHHYDHHDHHDHH